MINTPLNDAVFEGFLGLQCEEALALAAESDLLDVIPQPQTPGAPPQHFLCRFSCTGLVRNVDTGEIEEASDFSVGIYFPPDYLGRCEPFEVVTWLDPVNVWHPNIANWAPLICVGKIPPGTRLVDILYQIAEIITYRKVTMREDDAMNKTACIYARANQHRFPVDTRPLKRRPQSFKYEEIQS